VADPAKKPIRVTFLWADEAAVDEDAKLGYSKELVKWANDFYGSRYGFELDVKPAPDAELKEKYKYTLSKTGGYEPDIRTGEPFMANLRQRRLVPWLPWYKGMEEVQKLEQEESAKQAAFGAAILNATTASPANVVAEVAKIRTAFEEMAQASAAAVAKRHDVIHLKAVLDQFDRDTANEIWANDYDTRLRVLLGTKFVQSMPSLRTLAPVTPLPGGNPDITDQYRQKVIFCRFRQLPSQMMKTMRPPTQPRAGTKQGPGYNSWNGQFLWDGTLILVNLVRRDGSALAHELVHAAGRDHIKEAFRLRSLWQIFSEIKRDPVSGLPQLPNLFERVTGEDAGYYDGPADDIINYNSIGKKADQVKLYPDDQKRLEQAPFVVPPPASP
jgi:hypothetical protein